jgi:hypothetical protein
MSVNLSMIDLNLVFWVIGILVLIILVFGIFRFFFRHLLHFFFRGCGLILLVVVVLYILHVFKFF